jgi:hypothetical protein
MIATMNSNDQTSNHALQRTAPHVTAAASAAAFPPTVQPPRRAPRSLSLGSLGLSHAHMKLAITLFLVPLVCLAGLPNGEVVGSEAFFFKVAAYEFLFTKSALAKAPKWNPAESEFPPLSPKQAQVAAFAQVMTLLPDKQQHMHVHMIALRALSDIGWIYIVSFDYFPPGGSIGGPIRLFAVPVYLDGSTIEPQIRNDKR